VGSFVPAASTSGSLEDVNVSAPTAWAFTGAVPADGRGADPEVLAEQRRRPVRPRAERNVEDRRRFTALLTDADVLAHGFAPALQ